ncbi:hypothetical protein [Janibacter anophelis]|uniref:hypothetical protein n=1 Tax=Janibacter anophelis TaxID=319054 RepID=UPI00082BF272|nr:hypothetical protein [Janibacter anophelis]
MTGPAPTRRTLVKGAAWSVPAISVAAAAPALPASPTTPAHDLSTSVPGGGNRVAATQLDLAATNFINTGSETVEGITVVFEADSGQTIEDIQVFGQPIENLAVGATISGEGTGTVTLTLAPGTGLGQVTIPADGSYQAPAGQTLILGTGDAFNLTVTVSATNAVAGDVPFTTTQAVPAV